MSFLSVASDIAVSAGTEFAKTGAKYAAQEVFGGGSSGSRTNRTGLGAPTDKPIRFNKIETTSEKKDKTQKAAETQASEVWDKDPIQFTYEWMQSLKVDDS